MKFLQRLSMGIAGLTVAALLLVLVAPKAAHAGVAALVQVANTAANPVPVFGAGRSAYQSSQQLQGCSGSCTANFPAVPSGFRLVIENVSGTTVLATSATAPPTGVLGTSQSAGSAVFGFAGTVGNLVGVQNFNNTPENGLIGVFNQTVKAYVTSPDQPSVTVNANFFTSPIGNPSSTIITLSGYMENCSTTGCP
jgi:hypothetical protein